MIDNLEIDPFLMLHAQYVFNFKFLKEFFMRNLSLLIIIFSIFGSFSAQGSNFKEEEERLYQKGISFRNSATNSKILEESKECFKKAQECFLPLVKKGVMKATHNYAFCAYELGEYREAYHYYNIAAENGFEVSKRNISRMNLVNLLVPDKILLKIASYIKMKDFCNFKETCKRFYNISKDSSLQNGTNIENNMNFKRITFNNKLISESLEKEILKIHYISKYYSPESIIMIGHVNNLPKVRKIFNSFQIENNSEDIFSYNINSSIENNTLNYNVRESNGAPVTSNHFITNSLLLPNNKVFLHHDFVALNLLKDGTFISGLKCSTHLCYKGNLNILASSALCDRSVLAARGKVKIKANQVEFNKVLMRTPSWIIITPKNKEKSIIESVKIFPRLYYYTQYNNTYQSNTTCVSGKIDFLTALINLSAINAEVTINFNKKLLAEDDMEDFRNYIKEKEIHLDNDKENNNDK